MECAAGLAMIVTFPEGRAGGGLEEKPVPSKYLLKAARARRARRNMLDSEIEIGEATTAR